MDEWESPGKRVEARPGGGGEAGGKGTVGRAGGRGMQARRLKQTCVKGILVA